MKETLEGSSYNKKTFFTSKTYLVFRSFSHISHLEIFQDIAYLIELWLLYKTVHKLLSSAFII
jgi:hypothetical protein